MNIKAIIYITVVTLISFGVGYAIDVSNLENIIGTITGLKSVWAVPALIAVLNGLILMYLGAEVGMARNKYEVKYPTMYAIKSENKHAVEFNCYQRGHQNAIETQGLFLSCMLVGSQKYPLVCAVAGAIFSIAKVIYAWGYYNGPSARVPGALSSYIGLFMLIGSSIFTCLYEIGILQVPKIVS
mmetsp:Transcript_83168/g.101918  ORF Transcript_83168/g.101918 Transcript_83168/m.101918 type:complete len:184 (-) Transcript_83168:92-643(-)